MGHYLVDLCSPQKTKPVSLLLCIVSLEPWTDLAQSRCLIILCQRKDAVKPLCLPSLQKPQLLSFKHFSFHLKDWDSLVEPSVGLALTILRPRPELMVRSWVLL